jgi:hypothetical protein
MREASAHETSGEAAEGVGEDPALLGEALDGLFVARAQRARQGCPDPSHQGLASGGPDEEPEDEKVGIVGALEAEAGLWVDIGDVEKLGRDGLKVDGRVDGLYARVHLGRTCE